MPSGRPQKIKFRLDESMVTTGGKLTREWQDNFRVLEETLDPKYEYSESTITRIDTCASGKAMLLANSKLSLAPGTWRLTGMLKADTISTLPANWIGVYGIWSTSPGDNSTAISDQPILSNADGNTLFALKIGDLASIGIVTAVAPTVRVAITKQTDIYLVPSPLYTGAPNTGTLQTLTLAERISSSIGSGRT